MNEGIIKQINNSGKKFYISFTGCAAGFINSFLAISGASKSFLGAHCPYFQGAFVDFAGKVDNYASEVAARKLATKSYEIALKHSSKEVAIGLGIACSIASEGERLGRRHKFNIAVQTRNQTSVSSYVIPQGKSRAEENEMIDLEILYNLAFACGIEVKCPTILEPGYLKVEKQCYATDNQEKLLHGEIPFYFHDKTNYAPSLIFPGSFAPLHDGHRKMKELAEKVIGTRCFYEISVDNIEKPKLDYVDLNERESALDHYVITRAPKMIDKVKALEVQHKNFNGLTIVAGLDTFERLIDPKLTDYDILLNELDYFKSYGVKFLVFPRENGDNNKLKIDCDNDWYNVIHEESWNKDVSSFSSPLKSRDLRK